MEFIAYAREFTAMHGLPVVIRLEGESYHEIALDRVSPRIEAYDSEIYVSADCLKNREIDLSRPLKFKVTVEVLDE